MISESKPEKYKDPRYLGAAGAGALMAYVLLVLFLTITLVVTVWPNVPENQGWLGTMSAELRLLLLVASGGALGSALQTIRSFYWYFGNRRLMRSWVPFYLINAFIGLPLALLFYMVIRGGLLMPGTEVRCLNPYGLLAVSALIGLFSTQVTEKLTSTFSAVFGPPGRLEEQLGHISTALGVTTTDNYQGFVCLFFRVEGGAAVSSSEDVPPTLTAGLSYELVVWFQPVEPKDGIFKEINITGGNDVKSVEFLLSPDSGGMSLRPRQKEIAFLVTEKSRQAVFKFKAPEVADTYDLWVEVTQKKRFVQAVSTSVHVKRPESTTDSNSPELRPKPIP